MERDKFSVKRKKGINMFKELIVSIVVLISIFGLNYITQKNTRNTIEIVSNNLEIVRNDVLEEEPNKEQVTKHANNAYEKWEELDDILAYYIEHNELEKIKTALTSIKSYTEAEEYGESLEQIDKCLYLLEHIYQREEVTLDNIF